MYYIYIYYIYILYIYIYIYIYICVCVCICIYIIITSIIASTHKRACENIEIDRSRQKRKTWGKKALRRQWI